MNNTTNFINFSIKMVGQQYTAEQRNFLSMKYQEKKGTRNFIQTIIDEFVQKFPLSAVPDRSTVRRQNVKQNTFYTVHNLNSKVGIMDV